MTSLPPQPLSPLDGRYRAAVEELGEHLSEAGLNRARVQVEVEWLIAQRRFGAPTPATPIALAAELSPESRDVMLAHLVELTALVAPEPDAWLLVGRGGGDRVVAGDDATLATVELRIARAEGREAVVRRRAW